jgi:hypothetical protein
VIYTFYEKMTLPDSCLLGKRVFKKLFQENAKLGATDKKAFREDIDTIVWQYTLKPGTIPIQAYEDENREYLEVAILQVNLKTQKRTNRIAEIIHRAIPYPLLLVFVFESSCALSMAHKRFSQAEKGAIVAEEFRTTDWIDLTGPTPAQHAFLESLAVSGLPHTHFYAFYSALLERLIALDCARLNGKYRLENKVGHAARRERLAACRELELKIADLRVAIRNETQFNRQVELNTKIKSLEQQLQRQAALL